MTRTLVRLLSVLAVMLSVPLSRAQWLTQSFELEPGWNAIYAHVDASHTTLDELVIGGALPIEEVWLWQPAFSTLQFIESPQVPADSGTQWASWNRGEGTDALTRLVGNAAYLVLVSGGSSITWNVRGKPLPPVYQWTSSGLNLLGFPTKTDAPASFESYFTPAPELLQAGEFYQYTGGELGASNPARIFGLRTAPVRRGTAYWMRVPGKFNRYFGPVEIELQSSAGVHFDSTLGQYRMRLRNLTPGDLTIRMALVESEAAPEGESPITGVPPLVIRGELDTTDLTYGYASLNEGPGEWVLKPRGAIGSEVEVVLGLNRFAMTGNAGDLFAGILQVTDSTGLSHWDVPVSATVASNAGLWVGTAVMAQVNHYLVSYEKDASGNLVMDQEGRYIREGENVAPGTVARPFSMRVIVHNNQEGDAVLLQRAYLGLNSSTNPIVATRQSFLHQGHLKLARRVSALHFPWTEENNPWPLSGAFEQGETLTATVALAHDNHASNPFLHTYHPDHDNLDATFSSVLPRGEESYEVIRQITLSINPPGDNDFESLTGVNQRLFGTFSEKITFLGLGAESRQFEAHGALVLNRISSIDTLTTE